MRTERSAGLFFLLGVLACPRAQDPTPPATPTVADLISRLQAREKAVSSVTLKVKTRAVMPDGGQFETTGTLRVLGATHMHVTARLRLGDGMEGEHEVVRTPEGMWMRDLDPIHGEVFTRMTPALMAELEAAGKVLGEDAMPGAIPGQREGPLGSALLAALDRRFELQVDRKLVKDGIDHWVVRGPVRSGQRAEAPGLPDPDSVEVVVSERPLAVVRMAQFDAGKEILSIEVDDVQLDPSVAPASFAIDSRGKKVIDAMEHPPLAAQVQAMLEEAKRAREKGEGPPPKKEAGK